MKLLFFFFFFSLFFFFASWLVVASKPNTPFSGNIVSSWLRVLMRQTQAPRLFLKIVCSWVCAFICCKHNHQIFGTSSWLCEFVCCQHSRLFFGTSSWFREFVCCKHNRLIFGTSSWLCEFVCCQHNPHIHAKCMYILEIFRTESACMIYGNFFYLFIWYLEKNGKTCSVICFACHVSFILFFLRHTYSRKWP